MSDPIAGTAPDAAPGFLPLQDLGAYSTLVGPWYYKPDTARPTFGLRVAPKHLNWSGFCHGGMLATIMDACLSLGVITARRPYLRLVTVNLNIDYIDKAQLGDWLECEVDVLKIGRTLAYTAGLIRCGERALVKATAVFAILPPQAGDSREVVSDG